MQESLINLAIGAKELLFPAQIGIATALFWGIVLSCVCMPLFFRKKELAQKLSIALLFLYVAALLQTGQCLTFRSFLVPDAAAAAKALKAAEWNPFLISSFGVSDLLATLLRDLLLFIPIGILIPAADFGMRLGKMLIVSLLGGICLESFQLIANILSRSAVRNVSIAEAILSAAGCLTGYLIFAGLKKFRFRNTKRVITRTPEKLFK